MKIFTFSLLFLFTGLAAIAQHDTIPNHGFEHWTVNPPQNYVTPDDWNTLNPLSSILGIYTCYEDSTTPHSGFAAVQLVTKSLAGQTAPGILSTGQIFQTAPNIRGGIAIASRPLTMTGWYKYFPAAADTAAALITLYKSGAVIGTGTYYMTGIVQTWTSFTVNVNYTSNQTPDTVQLSFFSSYGGNLTVSSSLWVDDLSYGSFASGISDNQILPLKVYPNPAGKLVTVENNDAQAKTLNIYDLNGKIVNTVVLHEGNNTIDLSGMSAGLYLLNAITDTGVSYRTKLAVE